jgi:hypothetical protein
MILKPDLDAAYVVEHEEFGFGADEHGVADTGLLEVRFGAGRGRARVAAVELAGRRLDDVAEQHQHRGRAERVDIGRVEVRLEDHVGFVDRLPAGDRAAVEHEAVGQIVLVDDARGHGQMLPLALGVGETEVDPVDLLILDAREDGARIALGHWCCPCFVGFVYARNQCRQPEQSRAATIRFELGASDSPAERLSQEPGEYFTPMACAGTSIV